MQCSSRSRCNGNCNGKNGASLLLLTLQRNLATINNSEWTKELSRIDSTFLGMACHCISLRHYTTINREKDGKHGAKNVGWDLVRGSSNSHKKDFWNCNKQLQQANQLKTKLRSVRGACGGNQFFACQ